MSLESDPKLSEATKGSIPPSETATNQVKNLKLSNKIKDLGGAP
jgi:hypothetical protein